MFENYIRNFSIIAHIDHGKSTLADRLLEICGINVKSDQALDMMQLEREKGITIKAKAIRMYKEYNNVTYELNLIDTPGHVDFSYEVSRALYAADGAILLVDGTQGIQAQTVAHFEVAKKLGKKIIPVINKIDLKQCDVEGTKSMIKNILGIDSEVSLISAKIGTNVPKLLERIIKEIPPFKPNGDKLQAIIFDSFYDDFKGCGAYIKVLGGKIRKNYEVYLVKSKTKAKVVEVGYKVFEYKAVDELNAAEVGYVILNIKDPSKILVGDTISSTPDDAVEGFKELKPFVFAGIYPLSPSEYENLKKALYKLWLTDSAIKLEPQNSKTLGAGFNVGFLGMLHLEITIERLKREYNQDVFITSPTVKFKALTQKGEKEFSTPLELGNEIVKKFYELYAKIKILTPFEYMSSVIDLIREFRAVEIKPYVYQNMNSVIEAYMPYSEIIFEFHDKLKSVTKGYATYDYEITDYRPSELKKVEILVHNEPVEVLSFIAHESRIYKRIEVLLEKLRNEIPRHLFEVKIQARVDGRIVRSVSIAPLRKDVTAKCYGGDITRKMKLWQKQKEGKKKLKAFGKVDIPIEVFYDILKVK
ncbi:MAG: translation elongation factor 4 [bacterium]|nr:translation elongation factor 4 [bacterium]